MATRPTPPIDEAAGNHVASLNESSFMNGAALTRSSVQSRNDGTIRVGNGQAFWGDWREAPIRLVRDGALHYLTLDYLAEVTMSLLHKQRSRRPELGYPTDFIDLVRDVLAECIDKGIRIVTNAGGLNPSGCRDAVLAVARDLGLAGVRVASISGDDLMPGLPGLLAAGHELSNLDTGEPLSRIADRLVAANAYIGAFPIVEALEQGADVVIAGRCTDPSLVVGPLIYEYAWTKDDLDEIARGTIAGHVIECGAQCTGGNFEGGWWTVPDLPNVGYPIVEVESDGTFIVTKAGGTGGLVDRHTVAEQLLYELGDPSAYLTPDVVANLGAVTLEDAGPDRVRVCGISGGRPTSYLKVSCAYSDGYMNASSLVYSWPHAMAKAERAAQILTERFNALGLRYDELAVDYVGATSMLRDLSEPMRHEPAEVMLRIAVRGPYRSDLERFGREFAPVALSGPAGAAGFAAGRARPSEIIGYWPALIDKNSVVPTVEVVGV